jgi:hypothetical protein
MSALEGWWRPLIWLAILGLAVVASRKSSAFAPRATLPGTDAILGAGFLFLLAIALLTWRWPFLQLDRELNPDESQFMAQALKYRIDPLPWRSSNGGSAGPLESYVLVWPFLFGMKLSYLNARLTGIALILVTLYFYIKTAAALVGRDLARLAVLPLAAFYVFAIKSDFTHYSSEHLPMALMAAAVYLLLQIYLHPGTMLSAGRGDGGAAVYETASGAARGFSLRNGSRAGVIPKREDFTPGRAATVVAQPGGGRAGDSRADPAPRFLRGIWSDVL